VNNEVLLEKFLEFIPPSVVTHHDRSLFVQFRVIWRKVFPTWSIR